MEEYFEFECGIIPNEVHATGRVYTYHHILQMVRWLNDNIITEDRSRGLIELRYSEEYTPNVSTVLNFENIRAKVIAYSVNDRGMITVKLIPFIDDTLYKLHKDLVLRTAFIGSLHKKEDGKIYVSEDDSDFLFFYLAPKSIHAPKEIEAII